MNLTKLKVASEKPICFLVAGLYFTSLAADGATRPSSSVACITLLGTMSKQECGFPLHAGWLYFSGNCIRQQKCVLGAKFHRDVTSLYVSEFDCSNSPTTGHCFTGHHWFHEMKTANPKLRKCTITKKIQVSLHLTHEKFLMQCLCGGTCGSKDLNFVSDLKHDNPFYAT